MACRQWNPCTPCSTIVPYPCPSPCSCPTGPTGPASTGPTSYFTAQLSAATNTVNLGTVNNPIGINLWQVRSGNADGAFNPSTAAYTVPKTGVYTITFQGSLTSNAIAAAAIVIGIYVNGTNWSNQAQVLAFPAIGSTLPVSISTTAQLTAGQTVVIWGFTNVPSTLNWASTVSPAAGATMLTIKSEF